jgi:hypothetical protein
MIVRIKNAQVLYVESSSMKLCLNLRSRFAGLLLKDYNMHFMQRLLMKIKISFL